MPSPSNPLLALLGPDSLLFRLMRRFSRPIEVPKMSDPIKALSDEIRARQAAREAALSPEERKALQHVRDGVFREAFETGPAPAGGLQEFSDDVPASE